MVEQLQKRRIHRWNPNSRPLTRGMTIIDRLMFYSRPHKSGCRIWIGARRGGYGRITVNGKTVPTHRVAWEVENGPIPAGKDVLHSCDWPSCIEPSHLFLGNNTINNIDKVQKRRHAFGERHGCAKLTEQQVIAIRESSGTLIEIGKRFGVHFGTISQIKNRKRWTHLP